MLLRAIHVEPATSKAWWFGAWSGKSIQKLCFAAAFLVIAAALFFPLSLNAASASDWKLKINGASSYSENFLIEQLDLPPEMDVISPERRTFIVKLGKGNLDELYLSNGYFSADVSLLVEGDTLYTFNIFEGERYRFRKAEIEGGVAGRDSSNIISVEDLKVINGGFYDAEQISEDLSKIRDAYQKNGYLHLSLEYSEHIDTAEKKVDVIYVLNSKNQVRMGNFSSKSFRQGYLPGQPALEIGLSDTAWLNKLWIIPKDSVIDGDYYYSFRTKLFSTQLFSQLQLEDSLREDGLSDISLTAYERVPGEANYGFFFEELYGFGISFSSLHRNLFGTFFEGGVGALIAENRQELSLNYANPLLFGTSISWIPTAIRSDDRLFFNHEILPEPTNQDSLVERWEIVNRGNLTFGLSDHIRLRNTLEFRFLNLEGQNYFKIKGEIGPVFDFTDNYFDPIFGIRIAPNFGAGGELKNESFDKVKGMDNFSDLFDIGLAHGFLYTNVTTTLYAPFSKYVYSALAFSYGKVFNKAAEDDAQVFYQGGGRTLRGYKFRTVFPHKTVYIETVDTVENKLVIDTVVLGGLSPQYFRINEELRFNLPAALKNFQIVQFTDWARIDDKDKSFAASAEMSVGFGLRYKWQFLTIRLDYALKTEFKDFKPDKFTLSHIVFDLSQAI